MMNHIAEDDIEFWAHCEFIVFCNLILLLTSDSLYSSATLISGMCSVLTVSVLSSVSWSGSRSVYYLCDLCSLSSVSFSEVLSLYWLLWWLMMHWQDQRIVLIVNSQYSDMCWQILQWECCQRKWTELHCTSVIVFWEQSLRSLDNSASYEDLWPSHWQCVYIFFP